MSQLAVSYPGGQGSLPRVLALLVVILVVSQPVIGQFFGPPQLGKGVQKTAPQSQPKEQQTEQTSAKPLTVAGKDVEDKTYQECKSIGLVAGHCRHIRFCLINEFRANYTLVNEFQCPIEDTYVGVCCPDDRDSRPEATPPPPVGTRQDAQGRVISTPPKRVQGPPPVRRPSPLGPPGKNRGCGVSVVTGVEPVRSGGEAADPGEYPWMAAILNAKDNEQFCGGVILDQLHILTAAHCLIRRKKEDLVVVLGEYDLTKPEETRAQKFSVVQIRRHERFDMHTYENDIAIFTLDRPAVFNTYVWPVCLPEMEDIKDIANKTAIVIGWGTMYYGGPAATTLMEVAVPVWTNEMCQTRYTQPILPTAVCAGGYDGGKDSCQGDSGGPMMIQKADGRWSNIGVVSFGIRCGEPMQPGVYTKVTEYLRWIQVNTS